MTSTLVALRRGAWGTAGFAVAGFATTLVQSIAYHRLLDPGFGYYLSLQAPLTAVLYPSPVRTDTIGGYLELRAFGPLAILFAAWALVTAVNFVSSRSSEFVAHFVAFAISVAIAAAATCIGAAIGVASGNQAVGADELAGDGVMLVVFAVACYSICALVAQLTPWQALVTGGLMLALYFLNSLSRVFTQLDYARWLSPFRYLDVGGYAALIAIALAGLGLAMVLSRRPFRERHRSQTFEPSLVALLSVPVVRDLYLQRAEVVASCAAAAVLGVILAGAARYSIQALLSLPRVLPGIQVLIDASYHQLLARMWFDVMLLLFAGLALVFVARWSAEDDDGRLAAVLSAPYSRARLVVERVASLAAFAAVLAALSGLAVLAASGAWGMTVSLSRLGGACVMLVLFTTVVGAVGSLVAAWWPRAATVLAGFFVLAGYLDNQVGGSFGLPSWVGGLSAFSDVGDPLQAGLDWSKVALIVALVLAGVGTSILLMQRRDVGA